MWRCNLLYIKPCMHLHRPLPQQAKPFHLRLHVKTPSYMWATQRHIACVLSRGCLAG